MATIKLKFRPSSVPETEGTLYYQVIHKRKVKWISTGYHIYPCEWDEKTGEVLILPNSERKAELEKMQNQINWELKQWDSIIVEMGNQHKNVTINELCDAFNKTKTQKTVFMFIQEQVTKKEQMKRQGTAMTYSNAYRRFKEFREDKDLTFDELTPDMMECYEAWLKDRRLKQNSISCYLRTLCTLLYKATDEGVRIDNNLFSHVRLSYVKTTKRAISEKEMRAIATLQLPEGTSIAFARDVFMFSFYCRGMSFVDVIHLRNDWVVKDTIFYARSKTGQRLQVGLLPDLQKIIEKYRTDSPYIFPYIDSGSSRSVYTQYRYALGMINRYLKQLGRLLHIDLPLTTYVARHSWATIAKNEGIPISLISEGLGHTSEKTTQIYLASFPVDAVNRVNESVAAAVGNCIKKGGGISSV